MSERIYDLNVGDFFKVYGCGFTFADAFRVESITADVALCRQEGSGSILMLPLKAAMPFAVRVFSAGKRMPENISKAEQPAAEPSPEVPAPDPAEPEQPLKPAHAAIRVQSERITSVIDYFRPGENWGKVHAEGAPHGMFFHITQVEDDALRTFLASLPMGSAVPALKISYVRSRNPKRHNAICAGAIRAEEALPDPADVSRAEITGQPGEPQRSTSAVPEYQELPVWAADY